MAKKKKIKATKTFNQAPDSIKGLKKLKVGDIIMYKTATLLDKTEVIEINDSTAKLANQVIVSKGILEGGFLIKLGTTDVTCKIKVWDEGCDQEWELFKAKRQLKNITNLFIQAQNKMDKNPEAWITVSNKVTKLLTKLELC